MNEVQRQIVLSLHSSGLGYKAISTKLGISVNTIKSFCHAHKAIEIDPSLNNEQNYCLCCGKELIQTNHKKPKHFCSDKCRVKYWNSHAEGNSKYSSNCLNCGNLFDSTHKGRRFCSQQCYISYRFYRGSHEVQC